MIAAIQKLAVIASFCRNTTGTSRMTSTPNASVRIPDSDGTNNSENDDRMAFSLSRRR